MLGWRAYLKDIINDRSIRQSIATELHVNQTTLTRWTREYNPTQPQQNNLLRLLEILPEEQSVQLLSLLKVEYPDLQPILRSPPFQDIKEPYIVAIPGDFYKIIVQARLTTSGDHLFETITKLVLRAVKDHLPPVLRATILLFTPPQQDAPIRSLYHPLRPPMNRPASIPQMFPVYCGLEIFSPSVAFHIEPYVLSEQEIEAALKEQNFSAAMTELQKETRSAMLIPLTQKRRYSGYFIVTSERLHFFDDGLHIKLCIDYGNLLALGLADCDFYDASKVSLCFMPSLDEQLQKESNSPFTQRMKKIQAQAIKSQRQMRLDELEKAAIQQLEDEFIQETYYT